MLDIINLAQRLDLLSVCSSWNYQEWGRAAGKSEAQIAEAIGQIAQDTQGQAARMALMHGKPAGMALFIHSDLDTHPHLTPWLASLYVSPEFRGLGIGRSLVKAIEQSAFALKHEELFLYTYHASYYEQIDWLNFEALEGDQAGMTILRKPLSDGRAQPEGA